MTADPPIGGDRRGATFRERDLSGACFDTCTLEGARFRDCNLSGAIIVASYLEDLRVSSLHGRGGRVIVDDVDVSGYVAAELDRRYPERVALRSLRAPDDYRALFAMLEARWDETLRRAERMPEPARHERVDGEWSLVETLRHLVFADDCWISRQYRETDNPFHPLAVPTTDYPLDQRAELGLDEEAQPSYGDVLTVFHDRRSRLRELLATLTAVDLERPRTAIIAPAWGAETHSGAECLRVLLEEYSSHRRYAERDLAALEADGA
ncbi:MAG: DinB family protein [Ilumatobacteraceae bacterium]